jgi:hypothetical protein
MVGWFFVWLVSLVGFWLFVCSVGSLFVWFGYLVGWLI